MKLKLKRDDIALGEKDDESKQGARRLTAMLKFMTATAFFLIPNSALSQNMNDFSGSYFCTTDAVGGVSYNDSAGKWEGAIFRGESRYILNVKFFGEVENIYRTDIRAYFVTFSKHGDKATGALETSCDTKNDNLREINSSLSYISNNGSFSCRVIGGDLDVNLSNGRFLQSYVWGYVDGEDNNDNTPNIEIGKCSRIN